MGRTALITGVTGQDGAYLARHLLGRGYTVVGGVRRTSTRNCWRLTELGVRADVRLLDLDLFEFGNVLRVVEAVRPDEIYNLAAQSFVGVSFEQPLYTGEIDALGVTRLLEAVRVVNPAIRFYQASTSEMFGKAKTVPQAEDTPFHPRSPYGVAKLYAHWITVNYRESYGLHASSGILFNHESPLRGTDFVTRKITLQLAEIKHGRRECLTLGNLEARRDWGYAAEYVEGIHAMLQQAEGDDYVLATGTTHTVRAFVEAAGRALGIPLAWEGTGAKTRGVDTRTGRTIVSIDPAQFRPAEVDLLMGDAGKARARLGWVPATGFEALVAMMAEADDRRVRDNTTNAELV